jgi:integrase
MRSLRLSEATALRQLLVLSSVVRRGQRAELLRETPSDPFRRASSHLYSRRAQPTEAPVFSVDELQRLVARAARAKRRAKQLDVSESFGLWKLLLGLFTGIRLPELLSLRASDVVNEAGCWGLLMHTKSRLGIGPAGRRFVPLHPELLLCGFLDYAERRKDAGHTWLWFDSALSEQRQVAVSMALRGRFARDVAACGISGMGRGFSTLRRTFQSACVQSGMSVKVFDYLFVSSSTRFEGVNRHCIVSALTVARDMKAVSFDGLDLSGLYVANPVS